MQSFTSESLHRKPPAWSGDVPAFHHKTKINGSAIKPRKLVAKVFHELWNSRIVKTTLNWLCILLRDFPTGRIKKMSTIVQLSHALRQHTWPSSACCSSRFIPQQFPEVLYIKGFPRSKISVSTSIKWSKSQNSIAMSSPADCWNWDFLLEPRMFSLCGGLLCFWCEI